MKAPVYDQLALARIFTEVSSEQKKNQRKTQPVQTRPKFLKVYHSAGYPVDPRLAKARSIDRYVNAFAPQPPHTFNREPLTAWLADNIN